VVEQYLGSVPPGLTFRRVRRRYPVIAARFPSAFLTVRPRLIAAHRDTLTWWPEQIRRAPTLPLEPARALLAEAAGRFSDLVLLQGNGMFVGVQPMYDAVLKLIRAHDLQHLFGPLTGGGGEHAETEIVTDLWRLGRDQLSLAAFLGRHGYHGPHEGELSATVWREHPEPVLRLAARYRDRDRSADPELTARRRTRERQDAERELLAALPAAKRPAARTVLALARRNVPMRGVGKSAFLRAFDVTRAAARRVGALLAESAALADPEDVFYLTLDELTGPMPADAPELVAARRAERAELQRLQPPTTWQGTPTLTPVEPDRTSPARVPGSASGSGSGRASGSAPVTGLGVSAGIVEGVVRVVHEPDFDDVEPDEILVAPTTDPSWASIMFLSRALVVDIGGHLSHAAIVARELGVPCVVDTGDGTRRLRTGDLVRVDGSAGRIDIIEPADSGR
jgi:pyruvate,water dikinase